jgi:penicillin-binding protein 1A
VAKQAGLVILFVVAALLGTLGGVLFAFVGDVPEINALDDYRPSTITRLLARDGQTIGEFATERRVVVGYNDIAPALRNAIVATEDAGFNQHFGLSMSRIIVTFLKDILTGERAGASTLTQQLARDSSCASTDRLAACSSDRRSAKSRNGFWRCRSRSG